jgi:hypothetical protein
VTHTTYMTEKKQAIRIRITAGPDQEMVGKIGYLFDYTDEPELRGLYILTVNSESVKRVAVSDGYEYEIAEIR